MKEINIKLETKKVEGKSFKTDWKVEYGKSIVGTHPDVLKRYEKFNEWLADLLTKYQINPMKHEEFIKSIIQLYMWELDTDEKKNEVEELILSHPDIKKDIRKQKINKINASKNSK